MQVVNIEPAIKTKCPHLTLGCIQAKVSILTAYPDLITEIDHYLSKLSIERSEIGQIPTIANSRAAYKALGKEPSRYRLSAEALLRRVTTGKSLYQINNVVDLLNFISIQSGFSIGGYDATKIEGPIALGIGRLDEPYEAIGRGELNIANLPLLRDQIGAFGTPTSDSLRTMVSMDTQQFLMIIYSFGKEEPLEATMKNTVLLLEKFAQASLIETQTVS